MGKTATAEREKRAREWADEENYLEENTGTNRSGSKAPLQDIPPKVRKSYIEVDGKYYFARQPDSLAFEDRGHRVKTQENDPQTAASMVEIAEAKGWEKLRVRGQESFRREAWLQAVARGIEVKGYTPREEDLARLKKMVREQSEKEQPEGNAPEHRKYAEREASGPKLPKSFEQERETNEKPGAVETKPDREKNPLIENTQALLNVDEDLVRLAKEKPELVNEIAAIKMGEKFSLHIHDQASRKRFMEKVRERVADNYQQGQKTPAIRIREEQNIEKPLREKEAENER